MIMGYSVSSLIPFIRTPDARFKDLDDYSFAPRYIDDLDSTPGLRMHYLDEGPRDAVHTCLCLHGQPTWAYLYRKMIPALTGAGCRVIAPDFFGFGRSDKPVDDAAYTFAFHRDAIRALIERLNLQGITLVCQDWGGLIGLTLPMEMPERFQRLLVMNTTLATGTVPPSKGFLAWQAWAASQPDLDVGRLMARAIPGAGDGITRAYGAPFEDVRSKAGVRQFPQLVPLSPEMPGAAISQRAARWWQEEWDGESFMAIGMQDPVLGPPVMHRLRTIIRGCPPPMEIDSAGHFVQEHGASIAQAALDAWA